MWLTQWPARPVPVVAGQPRRRVQFDSRCGRARHLESKRRRPVNGGAFELGSLGLVDSNPLRRLRLLVFEVILQFDCVVPETQVDSNLVRLHTSLQHASWAVPDALLEPVLYRLADIVTGAAALRIGLQASARSVLRGGQLSRLSLVPGTYRASLLTRTSRFALVQWVDVLAGRCPPIELCLALLIEHLHAAMRGPLASHFTASIAGGAPSVGGPWADI